MTSNAQKAEEEKKLKDLEAEWLKEETRLRKEEEEWMKKEKLKRQEHAKRVRDASIKLKQKKEVKERNEELALEHQLLEKLLEDTRNQEKADVQRKSDLREENLRFMAYVAKNRKVEQEREKKLEEMIHEEVEVKWQKDLAKYRLEREARKKLLGSVLDTRRQQIGEKSKYIIVSGECGDTYGEDGNCYDKLVMNVVRTVMMCGVGKKLRQERNYLRTI
jgi:flagellar biosynthesis GTPase FlhF